MNEAPHIVIMAGEASGDEHGAQLVKALRALRPKARFSGIGGGAMAEAGVELLYRAEELALVGISEVFGKLGHIRRALKGMKSHLRHNRPDLLILIDFPDFNFRLAAYAKRLNLKVLYYISPQVWAWRAGRALKMASLVNHLAVVFPFEKDFYEAKAPSLPVTFVGHPLFDEMSEAGGEPWPWPTDKIVLGLLPGSRMSEITRLMPLLAEAAKRIRQARPEVAFALPVAPGIDPAVIAPYVKGLDITLLPGQALNVMRHARLLLLASGTATLQGALLGAPMIVVYKTGGLNYFLGKRLIKVPYIAMPNLIAGGNLLPELIQDQATPERLAQEALGLLGDETRLAAMREGLTQVKQKLGGAGACRRTAELALSIIGD